jgi:putative radical SAM enzyme (TIGR03279 family)
MTVRIARIDGRSSFFKPGDEIVKIGSRPVEDQLDVLFRTAGNGSARFLIRRGTRLHARVLTFDGFARQRLVFDPMRFIRCRSNCVFCFMDQMPEGMRRSLYEKDDDYRLSFLFGNFISLADVRERDIARIIELRLSPLYISVHAASARIRERMFGRSMRRDILRDLARLADAGITMHTQIVIVPGFNDGAVLRDTVRRLFALYPACRSVAIVPVGLTKHRAGLANLRALTVSEARAVIDWAERERAKFAKRTGGEAFLHLADEFYLATNRALPSADTYGDFPQLANGVGVCRHFLGMVQADIARLRRRRQPAARMMVVTGTLGARFMRRYVAPLIAEGLPCVSVRILAVRNRLFGPTVNVSGLLPGRDILRAVKRCRARGGCLVIPPNAVNHEGRFLDDLRPADVEHEAGTPVVVARSTFLENRVLRRCSVRCVR